MTPTRGASAPHTGDGHHACAESAFIVAVMLSYYTTVSCPTSTVRNHPVWSTQFRLSTPDDAAFDDGGRLAPPLCTPQVQLRTARLRVRREPPQYSSRWQVFIHSGTTLAPASFTGAHRTARRHSASSPHQSTARSKQSASRAHSRALLEGSQRWKQCVARSA